MSSDLRELAFTFDSLREAYRAGVRPGQVVAEVFRRIDAVGDPGIFLHVVERERLEAEARALLDLDPALPLWGIPCAIKDNIDLAGSPTTAACPAYTYHPEHDAFAVARLRKAGALVIGKTNLDQFATGLVGVRTPYPVPKNAVDPEIVPGGSSSGSAVAVAHGMVAFALGTDTAGSGRVPAALNGIVGLKPTLGALSASGVVPACRTLDTISVFALTVDDAYAVFEIAAAYDAADPYSRPVRAVPPAGLPPGLVVGVPSESSIVFDGDRTQAASFEASVNVLAKAGARIVEIDFSPLHDIARMLYTGAWLAEREAAIADILAREPDMIHPTTRQIIEPAQRLSAADAFRDFYRLAALKRQVEPQLAAIDVLCVPTIPRFVSVAEIAADPVGPNALLGTYTNFVNLLDLCALAVPTTRRHDGRPGNITLIAPARQDGLLATIGCVVERAEAHRLGATGWSLPPGRFTAGATARDDEQEIVVCGAHMSGLPLNHELSGRGGRFLRAVQTAPVYRLFKLAGGPPMRPGLVRTTGDGGGAIDVEVWALPRHEVGAFLAGVPSPLGLGTVQLGDGTVAIGFLCEAAGADGAEDVTVLGSWRRVMAAAS